MSNQIKTDLSIDPIPAEHYFDDQFVEQVRKVILDQYSSSQTIADAYDRQDVEVLRNDDWFIRRALAWRPTTVTEAAKTINDLLIWRKQININQW